MLNTDKLYRLILASEEIKRFIRSCEADKAVHTYIVEGENGSLRDYVALAAAMTMNCTADGGRPCFSCRTCRKILNGTHEDVHVYSTEKKYIPVEDIRGLITEMAQQPNTARYKTVIISEAEKMNDNGQNCLLKTLEEPTGSAVFFLVTETAESLLPTVRSRARILHAPRADDGTVRELLTESYPTAEREAVDFAVSLADGAPLLAEKLLTDEKTAADVKTAKRLLNAADKGAGAAGEFFTVLNDNKKDAAQILGLCAQILYARGRDADPLSDAAGRNIRRIKAFMEASDELVHYVNFNLTIDSLLIKIC